jgi:Skp family chaperone for outer membrane proteins
VSLSRVLEGLQQRADAEVELTQKADQIRAEDKRREEEIATLQEQFKHINEIEAKQQLEEDIALLGLNYQAWVRFVKDQLDVDRALLLQSLYRSIKAAIQELAETEGYDLVLVDDSQGDLKWSEDSPLNREGQTLQQIAARRVLYASPVIDVTDDLVERMNNKYRAGNN